MGQIVYGGGLHRLQHIFQGTKVAYNFEKTNLFDGNIPNACRLNCKWELQG
jgi:hypothetical protein